MASPREQWQDGVPGSGSADDPAKGVGAGDEAARQQPTSGTGSAPPKAAGLGDSELQEQPDSLEEARRPGPDESKLEK